jgi:hypothetical protein
MDQVRLMAPGLSWGCPFPVKVGIMKRRAGGMRISR